MTHPSPDELHLAAHDSDLDTFIDATRTAMAVSDDRTALITELIDRLWRDLETQVPRERLAAAFVMALVRLCDQADGTPSTQRRPTWN